MPIHLSERVLSIKPSASIAARKRVVELQAEGHDIIDFTIGEPDLDTPDHIVEAAIQALRAGDTHYTPSAGTRALRQSVANKLSSTTGHSYTPEQVVVGSGAKQIIYEAFMATLNPGDEVIIPAPYWVSYPDIVRLCGGKPVVVTCEESSGFKLTAEALQAAITPRTRWLVLNSPCNPTGAVYDAQSLASLSKVLSNHPDVMVITDDIYEDLLYDESRHANLVATAPAMAPRTLLVSGFSKSYAMTGWRVGYGIGPAELIQAIVKLITQSTTCVSSISQAGALAAIDGPQDFLRQTLKTYDERRCLMQRLISSIPGVACELPQGAFYLYPGVKGLMGRRTPDGKTLDSDVDLTSYLLDSAKVAVMDGTSYGLSPYLRLSYATSLESIKDGCKRIAEACAKLS